MVRFLMPWTTEKADVRKVQDPVSLHLMEAVMAALDAYNA